MKVQTETCENCGRTIGQMEQAMTFGDRIVCYECHGRLKAQAVTRYVQHSAGKNGNGASSAGAVLRTIGGIMAMSCVVICWLGYRRMGDPDAHNPALPAGLGLVGTLVGMLIFAAGRVIR